MSGNEQRMADFRAVCDRSGLDCWNSELVTEWTGMRVLRRFAEARHPQDFVRGVPDDPSVKNARPVQALTWMPAAITTIAGVVITIRAGQAITTIGGSELYA